MNVKTALLIILRPEGPRKLPAGQGRGRLDMEERWGELY